MTTLLKGTMWTFCNHYPQGYQEPFECEQCAKTSYGVAHITEDICTSNVTYTVPKNEVDVYPNS